MGIMSTIKDINENSQRKRGPLSMEKKRDCPRRCLLGLHQTETRKMKTRALKGTQIRLFFVVVVVN